ncbi:Hsp33 family molecular chaperone HslO [Sandarakinorhabdus sp.]|uniref:Hsp33 family molecular chaperone HslO n=1 Tax=Sandarakinorhabdus sp. TaxID=1916663 RepID=UPI00286E1A7B|nr:Hsp33 family molecular chaperone HslO [Sandarakinorhabdus sp.]
MIEGLAPIADRTLGFIVPDRSARGQVVRLDTALAAVLAAHDYPDALARLLAQALTITALVGLALRQDQGQLTLQAQAKGGAIDLLVCDWRAGEVRGYINYDPQHVVTNDMNLSELFGDGHLAITLDQTTSGERYQGIVALEGADLASAITGYFESSEQLPTLIRVAVSGDARTGWLAGGLLVQHLARSEIGGERLDAGDQHPDWDHVMALASTIKDSELTDPELSPEALLWRLFHEEVVHVTPGPVPARGCRCSPAHIQDVLSRFPEAERIDMRGDDGRIAVDCRFCARVFAIEA